MESCPLQVTFHLLYTPSAAEITCSWDRAAHSRARATEGVAGISGERLMAICILFLYERMSTGPA